MTLSWTALLGRPEIPFDASALSAAVDGRTVLVTGAGGSIGTALVRRLAQLDPEQLILFDAHEASLVRVQRSLEPDARATRARFILGDLRDRAKLEQVFRRHAIDLIFHLAAYKQVPLAEENVDQVVAVNLIGTLNLFEGALEGSAAAIIFPSTDKVVNLAGLYSCTKRVVEHLARSVAASSETLALRASRLVNVVDSQGNVVERFGSQIAAGEPITVTDPAADRYWITSDEALGFLLAVAGQEDRGGIYMIEPGRPLEVVELARRLYQQIRGDQAPADRLAMNVIGLRPGERLHEQLALADEMRRPTGQPCVYRLDVTDAPIPLAAWLDELGDLRRRLYDWNPTALRDHLFELARLGRPDLALTSASRRGGARR